MEQALVLVMALVAFANGANDNSKGVAALVGCGAARPGPALIWAAVTTALGALASCWLGTLLLKSFSAGLFRIEGALPAGFFVMALGGAFAWVLIATFAGLPVSTTHALLGGMAGAGVSSFGIQQVNWQFLGAKFALPLALSPLISLAIVFVMARPLRFVLGRLVDGCACIGQEPVISAGNGVAALEATRVSLVVARREECPRWWPSLALPGPILARGLHWMSGGFIGFARGWNDAPKIAALGMAGFAAADAAFTAVTVVTVAMALGGLLAGARVLRTLAHKVTEMPLSESLSAGLTTAALVGMASWNGLPVSTTHVSTGAIVGAGLRTDPRGVRWNTVGEILFSWLVTLPVAALLASLLRLLL